MFFSQLRFCTVALLGVAFLVGCASETKQDAQQQLSGAEATLMNFHRDPEMTWFRNNLNKARAIVISPKITRAGFVFGGSGGDAVVLSRDGKGGWAGPAFYNMGGGSFGLQAGVDVSEVVILVLTDKALNALLSRSFKLGGDASVAAGPVGVGAAAPITADMVAFSRAKGLFAGLSLDGSVISPDDDANAAFYGQKVSATDILVRSSVSNPAAVPLQQALTRATK